MAGKPSLATIWGIGIDQGMAVSDEPEAKLLMRDEVHRRVNEIAAPPTIARKGKQNRMEQQARVAELVRRRRETAHIAGSIPAAGLPSGQTDRSGRGCVVLFHASSRR